MRINRVLVLTAAAALIVALAAGVLAADYPTRPIRIINYVAPGGLMDVTTRKFTEVAAKYTNAVFVVENRTGAGGLVGMEYVLNQPADGYTIFAPTMSVVIQVVATRSDVDRYIWGFEWTSMLMKDPECIITNSKLPINTWEDVVADAKAKGGRQIWVGPSTGGNDHLMAMKVWDKAGIMATWIPHESGPAAMAALMGGQELLTLVTRRHHGQARPEDRRRVLCREAPQFRTRPPSESWASRDSTRSRCGAASA